MNTLAFVVDDTPLNLDIAAVLLKRAGWEVETFPSALPMLERLETRQPFVILLDISMPDMNGSEACARIRSAPALADIRVVAYTAHAHDDEHKRYLALGFDAVLTKPITPASIAGTVGTAANAVPRVR